MKRYFVCIAVIFVIMALSAIPAFSQDPQAPAKDDMAAAEETPAAAVQAPVTPPTPEAPVKTNEFSIYGEVQAVNLQAALISVQYYDYDNDEEKTLEVSLDKDSKLENVKALDGVKKGDWVDITYTVIGGKNIAKMVNVEAEEPVAENNAPVDTTEE